MNPVAIYPYDEDPLIRTMRVQTWYRAVALASGLSTRELEKKFGEVDPGQRAKRSCAWNRYKRGDVVPRKGMTPNGGLNVVDRVEAAYPGTAKWLDLPLWRLLDKAPMEMSEIRRCYEGMPNTIRSIFVASGNEATVVFWRRSVEPKHACEILLRFRDTDALVALLAMVREAEVVQDRNMRSVAMNAVMEELRSLAALRSAKSVLDSGLLYYVQSCWKST